VAAPVKHWPHIAGPALSALALGYLAVMVVSGAQPVQRQFVAFEAKGLMKTPPERISQVELARADQRVSLIRRGENGWATAAGAEIDAEMGKRISMAVQMMRNSGPAREIPPGELEGADLAAFGLHRPRIAAKFYDPGGDAVLAIRFGELNPDGFLQYARIEGDDRLYLMSRFIGEAWGQAFDGVAPR
jgi:hypothetical protein